jgi:hypothetical protein
MSITCDSNGGPQSHASNKKAEPPPEEIRNRGLLAYQATPLCWKLNPIH